MAPFSLRVLSGRVGCPAKSSILFLLTVNSIQCTRATAGTMTIPALMLEVAVPGAVLTRIVFLAGQGELVLPLHPQPHPVVCAAAAATAPAPAPTPASSVAAAARGAPSAAGTACTACTVAVLRLPQLRFQTRHLLCQIVDLILLLFALLLRLLAGAGVDPPTEQLVSAGGKAELENSGRVCKPYLVYACAQVSATIFQQSSWVRGGLRLRARLIFASPTRRR